MSVGRRALVVLGLAALSVIPSGTAWAQAPDIAFPPFDPAACVAKPQRLLILDLKSGWWSGDGAEFHDLLFRRMIKDCPGIDVEYYFLQNIDAAEFPPGVPLPPSFTMGLVGFLSYYPERPGIDNKGLMVEANFPSRPWNDYHQVWLLSGDDDDELDVPTTHEFFLKLLAKYATPATAPGASLPSYLVGAGIGHLDHANRLLASFQMPELAQTHIEQVQNPRVGDGSGLRILTRARVGAELTAHPLFEGVDSVADQMELLGYDPKSDFLLEANNPFQLIGRNAQGEPTIGVRETESRRWVIDTGLQRFYSLFSPTETATYRYLQNIVKYLAR